VTEQQPTAGCERFSHRPGAGDDRERHDAEHEPRKMKVLDVKCDPAVKGGIRRMRPHPQNRTRLPDRRPRQLLWPSVTHPAASNVAGILMKSNDAGARHTVGGPLR
jgi:hypothetical protein